MATPVEFRIRPAFFTTRIIYKQRIDGRWRKLSLPSSGDIRGVRAYIRLSGEEWQSLVPKWATSLKDEIEYRILTDPRFNNPDI